MKIEILKNDLKTRMQFGDYVLYINDERVLVDNRARIIEKLNKIIEAWI